MKEEQLAKKVITWLTDLSWDVYQEVSLGYASRIADIVAVQNGILWVIETKSATSLSVIQQAHEWRGYAHYRSVAVPHGQPYRRRDFIEYVCTLLGIGICRVGTEVNETLAPRFDRKICSVLKDRLCEEQKTYAPAGNSTGSRWTTFQATCKNVREFVSAHPGCLIKELVDQVKTHYHTPASARAALSKWIERGIIDGVEARRDGRSIKLFSIEAK